MVFINYIIEKICDKIEKAATFENIKKKFYGIKNIKTLEKFLIKLIKFIWDSQKSNYPIKSCIDISSSEKTVFLNMSKMNKLLSIKNIKIIENSIISKKEEEIILDLGKNKHINKDYRSMLLNENLSKGLHSYKDKFPKYQIEDICKEIDQSIMKYDQEMLKKEEKYDKDFFNITKIINNLTINKELMKDLFPFFWKNKSRIIMDCIDEDEKERILSFLCGEKKIMHNNDNNERRKFDYKKRFEYLDISKRNELMIISKKTGLSTPNEFKILVKNLDLTIQQKFNFKIIMDEKDKNNYIQCKPIILPKEVIKIKSNIEYKNNINFEIFPKQKKVDLQKNNNIAYY